jgi:hypothetical protein
MSKTTYNFTSTLSPDEILSALQRSADAKKRKLFGFGGYAGTREIVYQAGNGGFHLIHRGWEGRYPRRWLYVRVTAIPMGSSLTGQFDLEPWDRYMMRLWQAVLIVFGLPFFLTGSLAAIKRGHIITHQEWSRMIVPLVLGFYLGPGTALARILDEGNEAAAVRFVQTSLHAAPTE